MNNQFDELTKGMAQSGTRRAALKRFGVGLAGMALACFGLANKAQAGGKGCWPSGYPCFDWANSNGTADPARLCRKCCNGYAPTYGGYYCL